MPKELEVTDLLGDDVLSTLISTSTGNEPTAIDRSKPTLIPLNNIHQWNEQPRCYFSQQSIDELAGSFEKHGFKGVLVVREHPDMGEGQYQLIAGERRYRAAIKAELTEVFCFVGEFTDTEALDFALRENLNREDLSRLEETQGILELIQAKYSLGSEIVVELVGRYGHGDKARNDVIPNDEDLVEEVGWITSVLDEFGIKLSNFRQNYLPTLKLNPILKDAHLEGRIGYSKAQIINRIEDDEALKQILSQAIDDSLSVAKVREAVNQSLSNLSAESASVARGDKSKSIHDKSDKSTKPQKEKPAQCVLELKSVVSKLSSAKARKRLDSAQIRKVKSALKNLRPILESLDL